MTNDKFSNFFWFFHYCFSAQHKQPSKMSNWADLPHFIVYEIICRLSFFDDIFIAGAVCKSWKSVVNSFEKPPPLPPKGPW